MKELFSDRLALARAAVIVDDAPAWFRSAHIDQAFLPFVANDFYDHVSPSLDKPVSAKWLIPHLSQLTRRNVDQRYKQSMWTEDILRTFLLGVEWFHFFDTIEVFGELLLNSDQYRTENTRKVFPRFRAANNQSLQVSGIGWVLAESGKLERSQAEERSLAEKQLATLELNEPAKVHIAKARLLLNQRPCDAANVIKEAVSALESAGKAVYTGTSTLGDVLSRVKRDGKVPPMFVTVLEKLYGFASSEPGVRHGSSDPERVTRAEAEFIYTMTLATVSYLETLKAI